MKKLFVLSFVFVSVFSFANTGIDEFVKKDKGEEVSSVDAEGLAYYCTVGNVSFSSYNFADPCCAARIMYCNQQKLPLTSPGCICATNRTVVNQSPYDSAELKLVTPKPATTSTAGTR